MISGFLWPHSEEKAGWRLPLVVSDAAASASVVPAATGLISAGVVFADGPSTGETDGVHRTTGSPTEIWSPGSHARAPL